MQRYLFGLLLLAGSFQGTLGARRLQQIDPSVNVAINQQIQGVINNAQPLVNNFAQSVSNGLRNFNYSSIDWEKFATKVNSAANETMSRILPQPNVTAINADAEEFSDNLNKTVVENIPKFYDNFHWERPTLLNETLNELPLKDVVNQAINDQEPLLDRPEFYKAVNSLPVRPIFADGSVESFAQTRTRSAAPKIAPAPAPAPQLDAVSSAVGTVIQGIGALAYNTSAAAPVQAAIQQFTAAATAPAAGGQIVGPLATLINSLTAGTPLNAALQQARTAVAATPVGAAVDTARSAVGTAIANSPIGAVVAQARNAAAPVESLLQSARTLAAAPVSTLLQRAGSTLNGAPGAAPLLEGARTVAAQSPVGPLLQAARTAVASSPLAGIVNGLQNIRLPNLQGGNSNDAQVNSYARAPAPATTGGFPINVTEIAQGFTQQLNAAINNGVPALLPANPIDLFVRAINNNGGRANTNDITTRQSFQETQSADGSSTMTPLDDAKTEEADKPSEEARGDAPAESAPETKDESAKTESSSDTKEESAKSDSEASAPSTQAEAESADSQSESGKDATSSESQSADESHQ